MKASGAVARNVTSTFAPVEKLGPAFNRLWAGSIATNIADGLVAAAAPLIAATLTRNPVQISVLGAMTTLPWLLFAVPIGGLVDRIDRRKLLYIANTIRGCIGAFIAFLIIQDLVTIEWLYLVTFTIGITEVLADTSGAALIPQVLDESVLETGNSRLNISETLIQNFVGVPLGGLLFAATAGLPFSLSAGAFLLAAFVVWRVPQQYIHHFTHTRDEERGGFLAELKFGIGYLFNDKNLRRIVLMTSSIGFMYSAATSTFILYLLDIMHLPAASFGFFMTITGSGGLIGAWLAPRISTRAGRGSVMAIAMIVQSALIVAQGMSPNIWILGLLGFSGSLVITIWNVLLMSLYGILIPRALFGRIHGARRSVVWGLMPLGAVLGGFVAKIDLRLPFLLFGTIATVIALVNVDFVRRLGNTAATAEVS